MGHHNFWESEQGFETDTVPGAAQEPSVTVPGACAVISDVRLIVTTEDSLRAQFERFSIQMAAMKGTIERLAAAVEQANKED